VETMRDVRLLMAEELEAKVRKPAERCEVCDVKLPRGRRRTRCFDHSELVQSLIKLVGREVDAAPVRRAA
jgi:hypothetical protein